MNFSFKTGEPVSKQGLVLSVHFTELGLSIYSCTYTGEKYKPNKKHMEKSTSQGYRQGFVVCCNIHSIYQLSPLFSKLYPILFWHIALSTYPPLVVPDRKQKLKGIDHAFARSNP